MRIIPQAVKDIFGLGPSEALVAMEDELLLYEALKMRLPQMSHFCQISDCVPKMQERMRLYPNDQQYYSRRHLQTPHHSGL